MPALLGEAVWVGLYVGLGYVFAARLEAVGATMLVGHLAALAAAARGSAAGPDAVAQERADGPA